MNGLIIMRIIESNQYIRRNEAQLELVVATLLQNITKYQKSKEVVESGLEMVSNELDALSSSKNVNYDDNNVARYFGTPSLLYFSRTFRMLSF